MMDAPHPGIETAMLAARDAAKRALVGSFVRLVDNMIAVVTRAYSPEVVNVVTLESLATLTSVQAWTTVDEPECVCPVFWRHESGVQFVALIAGINDDQQLNLLVMSDGYIDLGLGAGRPRIFERVPHGQGHLCWQTEIDAC